MTRARPDWLPLLLALGLAATPAAGARDPAAGGFGFGAMGGKEPITVTADRLEYDYRTNVIVYRGSVEVTQGQTRLRSDTITITLVQAARPAGGPAPKPAAGAAAPGAGDAQSAGGAGAAARVQEIVATGSVRIDQGPRWATGGRAVFDQSQRTIVLSENPVLHDGPNEVQGDRVVVYLDEDRSVVEGGRKRVKAVLYPDADAARSGGGGAPRAEGPR